MAAPNSSFSEMLSTTIDNYSETLRDNILNHNALLMRLNKKGNATPASGGVKLLENLMYAENGTGKWYSGYETLDTSATDTLTTASFDWKQFNCNVVISGLEEVQNSGKQAVHNLLKARVQVAEKTMQNTVGAALFFSNTENGGKAIGGLQHLVADLPTSGTVGAIDRASNAWWANQYYDFSTLGVTASSTTIQHAMNLTYLNCIRGSDHPDIIVAGSTYFTYYEESLQPQQRFTSSEMADAGFVSYKYKGSDVVYDQNCAATRMYLLNTDYVYFRPAASRNFVQLDRKTAVNQDATVIPLYWMGNMTLSNASLQGVICA